MKRKVYKENCGTIHDMKENISDAIDEIPAETLQATLRAIGKKAQ